MKHTATFKRKNVTVRLVLSLEHNCEYEIKVYRKFPRQRDFQRVKCPPGGEMEMILNHVSLGELQEARQGLRNKIDAPYGREG